MLKDDFFLIYNKYSSLLWGDNMDKIIDNKEYTLKEDLEKTIKKGCKVSIVTSSFSIYAYEALKKNLNSIECLNFVFTSPTFVSDKVSEEKREFFTPKRNRENNL